MIKESLVYGARRRPRLATMGRSATRASARQACQERIVGYGGASLPSPKACCGSA